MRKRQGRRRGRQVVAEWTVVTCRAFLAACIVFLYVRGIYALAAIVGEWQSMVIAVGTGTLLGIVNEWLKGRGF